MKTVSRFQYLVVFLVLFVSIENMPPLLELTTLPSHDTAVTDFGGGNSQPPNALYAMNKEGYDANHTNATSAYANSSVSLWRKRFGAQSHADNADNTHNPDPPRKYIFFKHIRKAGGTFFRTYLDNVRRYHHLDTEEDSPINQGKEQLSKDPSKVSFYEQEFAAMDWQCSDIDPRWNRTLSITVLREPISRQISEFFYSGIRGLIKNGTKQESYRAKRLFTRYRLGKYGPGFYNLLEHFFPKWIEGNHVQEWLWRHFTDEFQVRAFSGQCNSSQQCPEQRDLPCAYGDKFGGGLSSAGVVDEERLRQAKVALSSFDLVLIMETMATQAPMVADFLGTPLQNASLAKKGSKEEQNYSRNKNQTNLVEDIAKNAPKSYGLLQEASKYESKLYEYAVSLNQDLHLQWIKEKA